MERLHTCSFDVLLSDSGDINVTKPVFISLPNRMKTGLDLSILSELDSSPDVERYVAELIPS